MELFFEIFVALGYTNYNWSEYFGTMDQWLSHSLASYSEWLRNVKFTCSYFAGFDTDIFLRETRS